jgi:hydroxypyruvate isomerase
MKRRTFIQSAVGVGAGVLAAAEAFSGTAGTKPAGRLKQSVCQMSFGKMDFAETCKEAARIGIKGYEMVDVKDWPTLKKYGLIPAMYPIGPAGDARPAFFKSPHPESGLNMKELHDTFEQLTRAALKESAANGCPNIIAFGGPTGKVSYEEGADLNVAFLNRVKAQAEDLGVNICLELLSHPNIMFNRTSWGVEIVKRVNSPRVGILYDIYHAQVLEGNIVQTIRDNIKWIKHIHTAGNPGRHQLDEKQELNYRFIAQAIADLNYEGWVGHEYSPWEGSDPIAGLKQAFDVFNV